MDHVFRVPADMPLYDILNEFQKGSSHMAAVVKTKGKSKALPPIVVGERAEADKYTGGDSQLTAPLLPKYDEKSDSVVVDVDRPSRPNNVNKETSLLHNDAVTNGLPTVSEDIEDGEVIGIITLEDVFEELLQVQYCTLILCHFLKVFPFLCGLLTKVSLTTAGGNCG